MNRTISINNNTYQQLRALSTQLEKSQAQVIDDLVKELAERMKEKDAKKLEAFNARMRERIKNVILPEGTTVDTNDLDTSFSSVTDLEI